MADVILKVGAHVDDATAALKKVNAEFTTMQAAASSVGSAYGLLAKTFGSTMAALAGGAAFKDFVKTSVEWNTEVLKLSKNLGITTQAASAFTLALDRLGIDHEVVINAGARLTRTIATNQDVFAKWNVAIKDGNGNLLPTSTIIANVNARLMELSQGTARGVAANDFYGRSWKEVQGLLKLNPEILNESAQKAKEWNLEVSPTKAMEAVLYKKSLADLNQEFRAIKINIGNAALPALADLAKEMKGGGAIVSGFFSDQMKNAAHWTEDLARNLKYVAEYWAIIGKTSGGTLEEKLLRSAETSKKLADLAARSNAEDERKRLRRIGDPFGYSAEETEALRKQFFEMEGKSGKVNDTTAGGGKASLLGKLQISPEEEAAIKWLNEAVKRDDEMYSVFADSWVSMQETTAKLGQFTGPGKSGKPSLLGQFDLLGAQYDDGFWSGKNAATLAGGDWAGKQFAAEQGTPADQAMLQAKEWRQAWLDTWAAATDDFEEYKRRELLIEEKYRQRLGVIQNQETKYNLDLKAQMFGNLASMAESFYALSGRKSREMFEIMKVMKYGETIYTTASAAMKSYEAMASIPYIGPVLGAIAAAAAIAAGMAQLASISSATPDGGGSLSPVNGQSVTAQTAAATVAPTSGGMTVNVHIASAIGGNVDQLARDLISPIKKAIADGAH